MFWPSLWIEYRELDFVAEPGEVLCSKRQYLPLMSRTETDEREPFDAIGPTVDGDFHLTEQQEDFIEYIDDPFHSMMFEGKEMEAHSDHLASFYPSSGLFSPGVVSGKIQNPSVRTKEDVIEGKELLNLDHVHADPTLNLYLGIVHHDDLAVKLSNAYNEWVLDEIYDEDAGIHGPIVVAPQKPNEAAEEIDRRKSEDEMVSVFIPSGGTHPPLGNEQYFPIYEAAEDAGLPVTFHNASGTQMLNFPLQFHGTNRYLSNHATTHPMTHMMHMTDLITRGVPVRFPDLDFVFQEAGLGWIPYMMRRLDKEYSEKREDVPMLEKMPSEYIRDKFYFTSQPVEGIKDSQYITNIVQLMGPENLMFSSDYPHHDFDHSDELFHALRSTLSETELAAIYGETALRVFGI